MPGRGAPLGGQGFPLHTQMGDAEVPVTVLQLWEAWVMAWGQWMTAGGATRGTVDQRCYHVLRMARGVGVAPDELQTEQLLGWLASRGWAANTTRAARAAYRAFYTWAQETGRVTVSPAHGLPRVKVPRGVPRPCPDEAYRWALRFADERESLAIRLAGQCGLRRAEVAAVRREDVEADLAGWSLRVKGKGGHVRMVPLPDDLARELRRRPPGWVFPSPRGGHLTPAHLGKVVAARLGVDLTTHNLRHRAGTKALESTLDLRAVQEFLGHSKPETTALYTLVAPGRVRKAMEGAA